MDISHGIRRHMFSWLLGIPEDYAKYASEVIKQRRIDAEGKVQIVLPTGIIDILKKIQKQTDETVEDDDYCILR